MLLNTVSQEVEEKLIQLSSKYRLNLYDVLAAHHVYIYLKPVVTFEDLLGKLVEIKKHAVRNSN